MMKIKKHPNQKEVDLQERFTLLLSEAGVEKLRFDIHLITNHQIGKWLLLREKLTTGVI